MQRWHLWLLLFAAIDAASGAGSAPAPLDEYEPNLFLQAIDQQSIAHGPYHESLAELFYSLGTAHLQSGDRPRAAAAFKRGIHVSRINRGIHSFAQEPMLRGLIDSLDNLGSDEQRRAIYRQLIRLYNRQLSAAGAEVVPILLASSDWHRDRYLRLGFEPALQSLQLSMTLAEAARDILTAEYGAYAPQLLAPLRQITESSYYLARQFRTTLAPGDLDWSEDALLMNGSYQKGLAACHRVVAIRKQQRATARDYASAQVALGDYLTLFKQHQSAQRAYAEAWHTLANSDDRDELERLFGNPVQLPDFHPEQTPELPNSLARVKVAIDHQGRAEHVEVLETYPTNDPALSQHAKLITQHLVFRAPLVAGKATRREGFEFNLFLY